MFWINFRTSNFGLISVPLGFLNFKKFYPTKNSNNLMVQIQITTISKCIKLDKYELE